MLAFYEKIKTYKQGLVLLLPCNFLVSNNGGRENVKLQGSYFGFSLENSLQLYVNLHKLGLIILQHVPEKVFKPDRYLYSSSSRPSLVMSLTVASVMHVADRLQH
jgi:hypothetical protein